MKYYTIWIIAFASIALGTYVVYSAFTSINRFLSEYNQLLDVIRSLNGRIAKLEEQINQLNKKDKS